MKLSDCREVLGLVMDRLDDADGIALNITPGADGPLLEVAARWGTQWISYSEVTFPPDAAPNTVADWIVAGIRTYRAAWELGTRHDAAS